MTEALEAGAAAGRPNSSIEAVQEQIIAEMADLDDLMDKYEHLVRLGRELNVPDEAVRSDENVVAGCQNRVWIRTELREGRLHIAADSEALITRGIIALILRILDGRPPAEITAAELHAFDATGLSSHLSPARADGLAAMVRRIREDARRAVDTMDGNSLDIRPFAARDEEAVCRLWRQAFPDDPPRNEPAAVIRRKLAVQRELFLVGESDGIVVAALLAGYDGFRCWVYHVAVDVTHRRQGYGRQMMRAAERLLTRTGCPKLNIQVRANNQQIVEFYKRLGYTVDDHISMGKLMAPE